MPSCPKCGWENARGARFCIECGARLAEAPTAREQRKVVTVLFCDLTGSTELGEKLDPEALRTLLARYFERMKQIVERHGGTVEKFIGDAVMAVFGVPFVHEDDALRAARAAVEMRDAFNEFGVEGRIGVTTGEVVTGTEERLATGDAVNVAARLEQTALPGQILIGEATYRLIRNTARAELSPLLELKGIGRPIRAWRLLDVSTDVSASVHGPETPFVGRQRELDLLRHAFTAAVAEQTCLLVTVLGEPGIGKSRLAREFVALLGERARIVVGRCLPYGEGITYSPLVEILRQIAGREPRAAIADLLAGEENAELIAELIASVLGHSKRERSGDEINWAARRVFETLARSRPIVIVLEDLHWAEPTFLDLVEYVSTFSAEAPILLLTLARRELLENRPSWATVGPEARLVSLQPLDKPEIETMIDQLTDADEIGEALRIRVLEVVEGNPLFVEQLLAMLEEGAGDELRVPATVQALLAARIDLLEAEERAVIERAAVEGRSFHRGAVAELLPAAERAQAGARLLALVRKGLIRPDRTEFAGEDGFRFAHILIRDAAYASMPKGVRTDLHERCAAWLEGKVSERAPEYDEILGYHLEQAFRYRVELEPVDRHALGLAKRAGDKLASAGRRAMARGDFPAGINLFDRALGLFGPDDVERGQILADLGWALGWTELARADAVLTEAVQAGLARGDRRLELLASLRRAYVRALMEPEGSHEEMLLLAERAIPILEQLGDEQGLTQAWYDVAYAHKNAFRFGPEVDALGRALTHARQAGAWREENVILAMRVSRLISGPFPLNEAVRAYEEVLGEVGDDLALRAEVSIRFAVAQAELGRFDEARSLDRGGWTTFEELGLAEVHASLSHYSGSTYLLADDPEDAEGRLRWAYRVLTGSAEKAIRSTVAAMLAQTLYAQGRLEESERFTKLTEETAASDDVLSQVIWRSTRAKVLSRRAEITRAESLARDAVARAGTTDSPTLRGNALMDLGEVLRLAGRPDDALPAVEQALHLHDEKGDVVSAAKARASIEELRRSRSFRVRTR
jgi:class 3 adenylate cyclase/tetratricopeptide (TPR) repeat protein